MIKTLETFYTPYGNHLMFVRQLDPNVPKLTFDTDGGSATLSWHQARDLHGLLHEWLMDVAHLNNKEN